MIKCGTMVYICSPLKGDLDRNIKLANCHSHFCVKQGFLGIAPHAVFTQYLDDTDQEDRTLGLQLGLEFLSHCQELWVFGKVISEGMRAEIKYATSNSLNIRHFDFDEQGNYQECSLETITGLLKELY